MKEFNNDYRMPAYGNEKTPQQVITEQRQIISELEEKLLIAKKALKDIAEWDEEYEEFDDPGYCAIKALAQISKK